MRPSRERPLTLRTAIIISLAAHLVVLALWRTSPGSSADIELIGPDVARIHLVRVTPRAAPPRTQVAVVQRSIAAVAAPHARTIAASPPPSPWPVRTRGARIAVVATRGRPARARSGNARPSPAPAAIALAAPAATPMPSTSPSPSPLPAATPAPTATPHVAAPARGYGGLFSQDYPPAPAAPERFSEIRGHLRGHGVIRIDVGEDGRATAIRVDAGDGDTSVDDDVRAALLALAYVPAECNGLHCEGTLELHY